jgi:hypothetical protein
MIRMLRHVTGRPDLDLFGNLKSLQYPYLGCIGLCYAM